jgi:hypothetical protein
MSRSDPVLQLLRRLGEPRPLTAAARARIAARLSAPPSRARRRLVWAVAAAALIGTFAFALPRLFEKHDGAPAVKTSIPSPLPELDVPAADDRVVPPPAVPRKRKHPVNAPSVEPRATPLGQAIRLLREEHDARAALAVLDEMDRSPDGIEFDEEIVLVRIEALMSLGDQRSALRLLDSLSPTALPNGVELEVLRGDLRAAAGRCAEAVADYVRAEPTAAPPLQERLLIGRAGCAARAGDVEGAKRDLTAYLRRFPQGRFAGQAQRALTP